jgi:hypothetical protein
MDHPSLSTASAPLSTGTISFRHQSRDHTTFFHSLSHLQSNGANVAENAF